MSHLYASPTAEHANPYARRTALAEDASVTPNMRDALLGTRPWVLFLAILGFIGVAFMVLGSIGLLIGSAVSTVPYAAGIAIGYLAMAVVYGVGSMYLYRYAANIRLLNDGYGVHAVERALDQQRSFWKLAGISAIVVMVGYFILVAVMVTTAASDFGGL